MAINVTNLTNFMSSVGSSVSNTASSARSGVSGGSTNRDSYTNSNSISNISSAISQIGQHTLSTAETAITMYNAVGKVTKVIGTGSATFNSVVNLNSKKGTLSEKLTGKYSEGLEKYLLDLEKKYGTKYVFENVFKGDKSKYDPVKRAEEICGFQTSRISNGNMAEQFNRVLNGDYNNSSSVDKYANKVHGFYNQYSAKGKESPSKNVFSNIDYQKVMLELPNTYSGISEYREQGYTFDGYTFIGICFGESNAQNSRNYFGSTGNVSEKYMNIGVDSVSNALVNAGICTSYNEAQNMVYSDTFYYQAAKMVGHLEIGLENNVRLEDNYESYTNAERNAVRWREADLSGADESCYGYRYY